MFVTVFFGPVFGGWVWPIYKLDENQSIADPILISPLISLYVLHSNQ